MSCSSQEALSIYVDGELPPADVRTLESHLVQCRRCRATVLALRDEVAVLTDVLQGRALEPLRAAEPRERARGLVVGLVPALGVAAMVTVVGGWLLETGLPAGTRWLSPIQVVGASEIIFDAIFVLRDRAPGLVDLALAAGALFGVAALLTFLVSLLGRRLLGPGAVMLTAVGAVALAPAESPAFDVRTGQEEVVIEAGEVISQTLVVSAESVRVDGRIEGDLVALAESIRIDGEVDGSVLAVGKQVELFGRVDDSLYVAGELVRIEGEIDDDLYAFAEDMTLHEASFVERDVAIYGERVRMEGKVGRDLLFAGDRLEVRGEIGRNLIVRADEAALQGGTRIANDFDVRLHAGSEVEVATGVTIGGERIDGVLEQDDGDRSRWTDGGFYLRSLVLMTSAFLVGMLLHALRPGLFEGALPTTADFFRDLGLGFATLVVAPVGIAICFATVVGIPLALLAAFVFATGLFVSWIVVAALLGSAALGGPSDSAQGFGRALLLGLLIVAVAVNLPFVGRLICVIALMTGVGMLVTHFLGVYRLRST